MKNVKKNNIFSRVILREAKNRKDCEIGKRFFGQSPQNDGQWIANGNNMEDKASAVPPAVNPSSPRKRRKAAFTLAEVLITLVVIGIVAAITIPVLHSNTNGKEWNAAKQKARAGIGEAFKLASVNNDLETMSAKDYVKNVLPKYIKMAKTCDTAKDCGFPDKIKTPEGDAIPISNLNSWDTITQSGNNYLKEGTLAKNAAETQGGYKDAIYKEAGYFQTADGFSVSLLYNPNCRGSEIDNNWYTNAATGESQYKQYGISVDSSYGAVCFNAVYDMNGPKGPNTVGKDVGFVGSFYSGVQARSAAVLPVPGNKYLTDAATGGFNQASEYCKSLNKDYDLPSVDELSLIFLNNSFVKNSNSCLFWSRSAVPGSLSGVRNVHFYYGTRHWNDRGYQHYRVRCVRADKLM